jgi:hypothetical protein
MRPEHDSKEPAGSVSSSAHVGPRVQRQRESLPRTPLLASWVNGLECDKEALTKSSEHSPKVLKILLGFIADSSGIHCPLLYIESGNGSKWKERTKREATPYVVRR